MSRDEAVTVALAPFADLYIPCRQLGTELKCRLEISPIRPVSRSRANSNRASGEFMRFLWRTKRSQVRRGE